MNGLSRTYEDILDYLDKQDSDLKNKKVDKNNFFQVDSKKQEEKDVGGRSQEPKIEDFIALKTSSFYTKKQPSTSSKGFSIKQFESLMRSKLIEEYKIQQSYERPYISVSELYNCLRQNYYSRMRYQVDVSAMFNFSYLYLIKEVGKKVHSVIQELYNFTEVEKTVVSEKYKVKGRADAIQDKNLFDIKTIELEKQDKVIYKENDFIQANIYTFILNSEYDYSIDNITLIYVPRTLKKIFSYDFKPDDEKAIHFLERAAVLLNYMSANKVPDPIGATIETCKYCLYKNYCQKDEYINTIPPFIESTKEKQENNKVAFLL